MNKSIRNNVMLRLVKAMDAVLMTVPFAVCWFFYYMRPAQAMTALSRYMILVLFTVLYTVYGKVYDAFLISYYRISEMIYSQILAVLIADGISYTVICMMAGRMVWLIPGIFCIMGQVLRILKKINVSTQAIIR